MASGGDRIAWREPATPQEGSDMSRTLRIGIAVLLALASGRVNAQQVIEVHELLAPDRPEAWAMNHAAAATFFTGFGTTQPLTRWRWRFTAELDQVPLLNADQRAVGFNGDKTEDLNKSPVFGRLRASVGLPWGLVGELGWTPPVTINGAKAVGLVSAAVSRNLWTRGPWALSARAWGERGGISGDITCPAALAGLADPQRNPYDCQAPSKDHLQLDLYGVEFAASRAVGAWRWHAGAGYVRTELEVQVDARTFGFRDRTRLTANAGRHYLVLGIGRTLGRSGTLTAELLHEPLPVRRLDDASAHDDAFTGLRLAWAISL